MKESDPSVDSDGTLAEKARQVNPNEMTLDASGVKSVTQAVTFATQDSTVGRQDVLGGAVSIPGYRIDAEIAKGRHGSRLRRLRSDAGSRSGDQDAFARGQAERFITEAKITAKLPHPGIPPVHALGTLDDGTPWLAMKLIRGQSLAELLKKRSSPSDELPRFLQVFEQVAQAVGFAHSRGIIHRDLKPLNVMVGEFGEVQVMDWGLAKDTTSRGRESESRQRELAGNSEPDDSRGRLEGDNDHLTTVGAILGTPGYMAPEQARGEVVDARADVFALGSILAAILTGKPAFVGTSQYETIAKAASADLADVLARLETCEADAELVAIARRCLAAQRDDRFADGREVASAVASYRATVEARLRQAETEAAEALVREAEQRKRRRLAIVAGGIIVAVLLAGLAVSLWQMQRAITAEGQAKDNEQLALANAKKERMAKVEAEERRQEAIAAAEKERLARQEAADRLTQIELINNSVFDIFTDFDIRKVKAGPEPVEYVLTDRLIAAGKKLDERAIHDPLVLANLRDRLGQTVLSLGRAQEAIEFLAWARDTRQAKLGPDHPATLQSMNNLAAWLDEAALIPSFLPAGLGPIGDWPSQNHWCGQEHVDPAKEATAQATRLANHTTTLAHEYARQGRDWEEALRQRAKEVALMQELGLTPAQAQPTPADQEEESVDDEAELEEQAA